MSNFEYLHCTCGSIRVSIALNLMDGDKPWKIIGALDICGKCKIIYGAKVYGRIFGIDEAVLKRAYKATWCDVMTLDEWKKCGAMDYQPDKFIEPKDYEEVPF